MITDGILGLLTAKQQPSTTQICEPPSPALHSSSSDPRVSSAPLPTPSSGAAACSMVPATVVTSPVRIAFVVQLQSQAGAGTRGGVCTTLQAIVLLKGLPCSIPQRYDDERDDERNDHLLPFHAHLSRHRPCAGVRKGNAPLCALACCCGPAGKRRGWQATSQIKAQSTPCELLRRQPRLLLALPPRRHPEASNSLLQPLRLPSPPAPNL